MTQLENTLRALADDPFEEPAPGDLADRALTRARQRSRRRGALAVVGAAAVAGLVTAGITTAVADQQHRRQTSAPAASTSAAPVKTRMNLLLIGSDAGPDRIGARPDTIMLASIDTRSGATTLLSLPRSLQHVPFPAGSPGAKAWPNGFSCPEAGPGDECLLNAVWFWAGQAKGYRDLTNPGLTATTQVVEQISGLTVDDSVVLTMPGLVQLVDAVGGVDVTVPERLPIGGSSKNHVATGGYIEKGRQHLDGQTALWFARSRWSTDDYSRIRRQQCLITALSEQVDGKSLIRALPTLVRALKNNLYTTIDTKDLPAWAELAPKIATAKVSRISEQMPGGSANPDYPEIRRRVAEAIQDGGPSGDPSWLRTGGC